jgi:hypothetical protein
MEWGLPDSPRADRDLQKGSLPRRQEALEPQNSSMNRVNNQCRTWNSNFLPLSCFGRGNNKVEIDSGTFSSADFTDNWTRNWTWIPTRTNCHMDSPLSPHCSLRLICLYIYSSTAPHRGALVSRKTTSSQDGGLEKGNSHVTLVPE